ncbi:response regulator [Sphingomonas sp. GC_Shp_3]|uniref:sensor histidine kinase n=1 Tax=Sphingomonas sp. GC_Shp_3 TaxID=2937383 RepID=UPI00226A1016|nr:response regulator [Sphingomonas sp. GC_Shp_3]
MLNAVPASAATHVLYIDDDEGLRRLVGRSLARHGFVVTVAEGGPQGLELAKAQRFDLIAVDHYMPGMDGLETLAHLRTLPDAPPVVYVTGSEEGRIAVAALKAGAADYVVKAVGPDFFDLLVSSFSQVLERTRLERDKLAAEQMLRASNARLEALLREVNHRVANSLQIVSAMVRLQSTALVDDSARAALEDTQRRIAAIAQVHRRLYTTNDVEQVDMREYLGALVDELGETWSSEAEPRTLTLSAEPIRLTTDRAVSLGVIVTELVSNACKYAYPLKGGEVRIALSHVGDEQFRLAVEDDGIGMDTAAPARGTGVGTKLIRAMAQSLHSIVEYDVGQSGVGGVRATLTAALG